MAPRDGDRPDLAAFPAAPTTRFAPAPTGYLHLGHVANAIFVWGIARATGGRVILRIEDHDRQRCRPEYEAALLDDLEWLGLVPDEPSVASLRSGETSAFRQTARDVVYRAATHRLAGQGRVYACRCSRADFDRWASAKGRPWHGAGCPGDCRTRGMLAGSDLDEALGGAGMEIAPGGSPRPTVRAWIGEGEEAFTDALLGPRAGSVAPSGDPPIRDRHGNWTYGFAVVVDDIDHAIDLVVRGRDLLHSAPGQIRLAGLLGRAAPPVFAHHPLIRKPGGAKLSKADGDTGIRDLRATGWTPGRVLGGAAAAVGLVPGRIELDPAVLAGLFGEPGAQR